jgi:hypothetical protein
MRASVFFASVCLAAAGHDTADCALNGARAVDDLLDSATYIWASVKRCEKPPPNGKGNAILCSLDVSSAIESVNAMVNVILKGVEKCGHLEAENHKCGLAVGVLTKAFAGLAASSSGVTAKCPNKLNGGHGLTYLVQPPGVNTGTSALASAAQQASFAQCLVDVKDLTKSLFKATKRIITVKENCDGEHPRHCEHNGLKIVASFAAMGEYLAGAVGRCSAHTVANDKLRENGQCSAEVMGLVRHLSNLGRASVNLNKYCEIGAERLYQLENGDGVEIQSGASSSTTLGLAALLPIAAVFSFVGGSRFAKTRAQSQTDFGSVETVEE